MATEPSPPTARVLDILELVAAKGDEALRAADVARELDLAKATVHAILHTLGDRGWLVRSTDGRRLRLGPGLAPVVSAFADQRTLTRLTIRAAAGLSSATGWTASTVELIDNTMYVSTIDPGDPSVVHGERVPYAAPLGTLFAAWAHPDDRLTWLRRGRLNEAAIAAYGAHLDQARADGVLIERMSPVVEHVASLVQAADQGAFPEAVAQLAGDLLDEVVRTSIGTREAPTTEHPVTSIAAPVPNEDGTVTTALALHPFRQLTNHDTRRAASMVRQAARSIGPSRR
jgi:DNA-binding IclR family transcriptional regulator